MQPDGRRTKLADVVTPRRLVTTALIALAVLLSVVGLQGIKESKTTTCGNPAGPIVTYLPCPGQDVLRQSEIGVVMAGGYRVDLSVDGTPIPQDQVRVEGNIFTYTPGPGTVTGALAPRAHTARVVYYTGLANEADGTPSTWTFYSH